MLDAQTWKLVMRDLASGAEGVSCEFGVFRFLAPLTSALLPFVRAFFQLYYFAGGGTPPHAFIIASPIRARVRFPSLSMIQR